MFTAVQLIAFPTFPPIRNTHWVTIERRPSLLSWRTLHYPYVIMANVNFILQKNWLHKILSVLKIWKCLKGLEIIKLKKSLIYLEFRNIFFFSNTVFFLILHYCCAVRWTYLILVNIRLCSDIFFPPLGHWLSPSYSLSLSLFCANDIHLFCPPLC